MTAPVSPAMHTTIRARLDEIERDEDIRILLAIESGSRAWGFHSPDSDYDVRFVYARPPEWHYRLGKKRDVVERPIDDELDISGWELSKALTLALGSNAVIAEWLQSPIVYHANPDAVMAMRGFVDQALSRKSVSWHYVALFERQAKRLAHPDGGIRIKRFFYLLRPALALRWMRVNDRAVPPMTLSVLREGSDLSGQISDAIDALLVLKMAAREKDSVEAVDPVLMHLVNEEADITRDWLSRTPKPDRPDLWDEASRLHMSISQQVF